MTKYIFAFVFIVLLLIDILTFLYSYEIGVHTICQYLQYHHLIIFPLWIRRIINPFNYGVLFGTECNNIYYNKCNLFGAIDKRMTAYTMPVKKGWNREIVIKLYNSIVLINQKRISPNHINYVFNWYFNYRKKTFYEIIQECLDYTISDNSHLPTQYQNINKEAIEILWKWCNKCSPSQYNEDTKSAILNKIGINDMHKINIK